MRNSEYTCITIVLCPPLGTDTNWNSYVPEYIPFGACVSSGKDEEDCVQSMYKDIRIFCEAFNLREPKKVLICKCEKVIQMPKRAANDPIKVKHLFVFEGGAG